MLQHNVRSLLLALGVSDWNAQIVIPYTFMTPSTTDPGMSQIIILVRHLQRNLQALGASDVKVTGRLDQPTGAALAQISGNGWLSLPWYEVIRDVVKFGKSGQTLVVATVPVPSSGIGDFALPDVPGGFFTYGAGAFALWYFLVKKKRRA